MKSHVRIEKTEEDNLGDSMKTIVKELIDAAARHGAATESGDYRTGNKQYKRKDRLRKRLEGSGEVGQRALYALMKHPNPWVRISAATPCLKYYEKAATKVLKALETEPGIISLSAKMVLSEWRKGLLKP